MFDVIKNVSLQESSWSKKIFLTFDIDWADDEVFEDTIQIIEKYDIAATFFITHDTKLLTRLRENPKIELGIHPNFNPLLNGDFSKGRTFQEVIVNIKKLFPRQFHFVLILLYKVLEFYQALELHMM